MSNAINWTSWHKFVERYDAEYFRGVTEDRLIELLTDDTPVFRMDQLELEGDGLSRGFDQYRELRDFIGDTPLPFDKFIIETTFHTARYEVVNFIIVEKDESEIGYTTNSLCYVPCIKHSNFFYIYDGNTEPVISEWGREPHFYTDDETLPTWLRQMAISRVAVEQLIVALRTKGIVADKVAAPGFTNSVRAKKGKPRIPDVTVIRIGHYYNKSGEKIMFDTRQPVKVHWRRGHIRNVWCGVGDHRRREPRWIEACLVNYDEAVDPLPPQQIRVLQ